MDFLKRLIVAVQLLIGLIPVVISVIAVRLDSVPCALAAPVAVFIIVAIVPLYRHRESVWVFLFIFLTMFPLNRVAILLLCDSILFEEAMPLTTFLSGLLMFLIFSGIQELVCSVIARLIWKRQYKTASIQL